MLHPDWKTCVSILLLLLAGGPALTADALQQKERYRQIESMRRDIERNGYGFKVDAEALAAGGQENLNGYIPPPQEEKERYLDRRMATTEDVSLVLPKRWNWMDHDGVTAIKNQRPAGTCWAFSTVAPLECNILIHDGVEEDLSEQYLVSCNNDGLGCNTGGWAVHKYFAPIPPGEAACDGLSGAVLEADFPYQCSDEAYTPGCAGNYSEPLPRPYLIEHFAYVPDTVAAIKEAIYKYGPISASVAVDPYFSAYAGGVFDRDYDSFTNHAISLVGWDDTQGEDGVWFLRNSWGDAWGEEGNMRIEYHCSRVGEDPAYVVYNGGVMTANGLIALDDEGYACAATVGIVLRDSDLASHGSHDVVLSTDGGDSETVTLSQTDVTGNLWGILTTAEGTGCPGDGVLQVTTGDIVTVAYVDADDGRGGTDLAKTYTAYIDCLPPAFDGLLSASGSNGYVGLAWMAAEDPHGPIKYNIYRDQTPRDGWGDPIATTTELAYRDYTVDPGETYVYTVQAMDGLGNEDENTVIRSAAALAAFSLERASMSDAGTDADDRSAYPSASADGRYVAFESSAANLVDGDTNDSKDVFVYDRDTATVERVSRAGSGIQGNGTSCDTATSANGRFVAFESSATNLVPDDINGKNDIFVFDRESAAIEMVSVSNAGVQGIVSSDNPTISADGRYVAFSSAAANLVAEDTNAADDVFSVGPLWSEDNDGDGIPDDGDLSGFAGDAPCDGCQTLACDDNCRTTANPSQTDTDNDGYGNACDCDLNNDGQVGMADFMQFRGCWGSSEAMADFDHDGHVGMADFMILRVRWGGGVPFE